MKTFDLNVASRAFRDQLEASEELLDVVDKLKQIVAMLPPGEPQERLMAAASRLLKVSSFMIATSGNAQSQINEFVN